jgi:hypothetical protein
MSTKFEPIIPNKFNERTDNPPWFVKLLFDLISWCNNLRGITYSQLSLNNNDIPIGKTNLGEVHYPLVLLAEAFWAYETDGVDFGPPFTWNPNNFSTGNWYLEGGIYVENAAATATLTLKSGGDTFGTITTQSIALGPVRSAALTMPTEAKNLYLNLKTNNASYAALLMSAKLIYVP